MNLKLLFPALTGTILIKTVLIKWISLYGAFIVEGTDEKVDRDYTLVLDEWMSMGDMDMSSMDNSSMNMDMSSMDHSNMNMDSSKDQASSENNMDHGNMGDDAHGSSAEGHDMSMYDIYSINGKSGDSIDKLIVKKGEKVRIRLVNAGLLSHNIHLHGHEFKVVSTDGQPINNPASINDQVISIAPGERYDLEFEANNPGQWYIEDHGDDPRVKGMKPSLPTKAQTQIQTSQTKLPRCQSLI